MNKEKFWDMLTEESKEKVAEMLENYAGSDGYIGRIFELYEEGATEVNMTADEYLQEIEPNDYVNVCYDSFLEN